MNKQNLLMLAKTVGVIRNELDWIIEYIRTEAARQKLEIDTAFEMDRDHAPGAAEDCEEEILKEFR